VSAAADKALLSTRSSPELNSPGNIFESRDFNRLKGDAILIPDSSATAEACFRKAIEIARRQSAK
jgi:hypothetical protein